MDNFFYIWVVVGLLCLLLEMGHPGLFLFLSFALGALVTAISTICIESPVTQCTIFLVASLVSLVVLLRWVKNTVDKEHAYQKTNTQALLGMRAFVTKDINSDAPGEVKIGGELWTARGLHNQSIKAGTQVSIVQVRGAHVVVEPVN